jgi:hypothetical protein
MGIRATSFGLILSNVMQSDSNPNSGSKRNIYKNGIDETAWGDSPESKSGPETELQGWHVHDRLTSQPMLEKINLQG